jgi:hypothetical protein
MPSASSGPRMTYQSEEGPLLHAMTMLAFALHIGGGTIGLASGLVAAIARKGGHLHRKAEGVFLVSMLVMATFAIYLAVAVADQIVNVFLGTLAIYLVETAWTTIRRKEGTSGRSDKLALLVVLCLCAPFAILAFQLATGLALLFTSVVPFKGLVLIAIYLFTSVLALAAIGDARVVLAGGISGGPRIARHLWRMCLGLTLALGSFFTNALPRLLPGPMHVTTMYFVPQLLALGFLIYWMIRVRFTGCANCDAVASPARLAAAGFSIPGRRHRPYGSRPVLKGAIVDHLLPNTVSERAMVPAVEGNPR